MIGVKLQGRTGNQLFQYAFAYIVARQRGVRFFTDHSPNNYRLHYFQLVPGSHKFYNALKKILFKLSHIKPKTLVQTGNENYKTIMDEAKTCDLLDGYFQSEKYHLSFYKELKEIFTIKKEYEVLFEKKYKTLFQNTKTLVIHVRLTDYLTWNVGEALGGTNTALPFKYIETVMEQYKLLPYTFIFISDDINAVKSYFGEKENYHFESNDEIIDLQLLMHADVLCLSNSSFSWWGAYLNVKPDKKVFAPEHWLGFKKGFEYPADIICSDWIKTPVTLN